MSDAESAELSRNLRMELLTLDVDQVRPVDGGAPPAGAKAGEAVAFGSLLVSMAPTLLEPFIDVVVSWLRRQHVEVEVEIGGQRLKGSVTRKQRDQLVTAFLDHAKRPGPQ
ncbi:MAG TPA: hypothetical protein VFM54_14435 [Micromonosporaceae bacterium]|nr:hypothetical protein [Micromonosporaceae bacterium]